MASHLKMNKSTATPKPCEDTMCQMIKGLNLLILQANSKQMGTAAKILYTAKEELVHWAANMHFHETAEEKFINKNLYDGGPFILSEFIARVDGIEDSKIRETILNAMGFPLQP